MSYVGRGEREAPSEEEVRADADVSFVSFSFPVLFRVSAFFRRCSLSRSRLSPSLPHVSPLSHAYAHSN